MKDYVICGIQQIGIGVTNLEEAWKWYILRFGMDCRIFEEDAEAKLMLPYTGGQPRSRHAVLAFNLQSGGGFEIWQYKGRVPQLIAKEIRMGDLGITACKIKTRNIRIAHDFLEKSGTRVLNTPSGDPAGNPTFFLKDPYGNLFQLVETNGWFMEEKKISGGTCGAIIGVTDIERSRAVYSDILGYDKVVYDSTGVFPDLASIPGGENKCRRILLRRSEAFAGPFSRILGQSEIELLSKPDNPGKKIYEGRLWGDPGFIHLCYDMRGMNSLRNYCEYKGFPFKVDSEKSHEGNSFDMGEAAGHFSYIEDPDGTLIEFVETHKLPVLKKLGWYLNLKNRDPYKPLPDWILKTLRFSKVKG